MLVVASAAKPKCSRMRAEPASHGLGMMKAAFCSCNARKAAPFSLCVRAICASVPILMHTRAMRSILRLTFFIAIAAVGSAALNAQELSFREMRWRDIGPTRAGRARALAGVANQPNVFYAGFDNGGVWRSTDFGANWVPIFDDSVDRLDRCHRRRAVKPERPLRWHRRRHHPA